MRAQLLFCLLNMIRYVSPYFTYFLEENVTIFEKGRSELVVFNLNTTINGKAALFTALDRVLKIKSDSSTNTTDEGIKLQRLLVQCRDMAQDIKTNIDIIPALQPSEANLNERAENICTYSASPFLTSAISLKHSIDKELKGYKSLTTKKKIVAIQALITYLTPFSNILKNYVTLIITLLQSEANEEVLLLLQSLNCRHFEQFHVDTIECSIYNDKVLCDLVLDEKIYMENIKRYVPVPYRNITVSTPFYSDQSSIFLGSCDDTDDVCDFTSIENDECSKWRLQVLTNNEYSIHTPCERHVDERLFLYIDHTPVILQNADIIFNNGSSYRIQPPSIVKTNENCKVRFGNGESLTLFPTNNNFTIIESALSMEEQNLLTITLFPTTDFLLEYLDTITIIFLILSYITYTIYNYGKLGCNKRKFKSNNSNKVESKALLALLNADSS